MSPSENSLKYSPLVPRIELRGEQINLPGRAGVKTNIVITVIRVRFKRFRYKSRPAASTVECNTRTRTLVSLCFRTDAVRVLRVCECEHLNIIINVFIHDANNKHARDRHCGLQQLLFSDRLLRATVLSRGPDAIRLGRGGPKSNRQTSYNIITRDNDTIWCTILRTVLCVS